MLSSICDADLRTACKERLEALEHWLRRLVEDELSRAYGDYFEHVTSRGDRIVKKKLASQVDERRAREPSRYPRKVDAIFLEDCIELVCNESLFTTHFRDPLRIAYPEGREEARTFLRRLLAPRNSLAHSNPISVRQAEQVICYSNDVIDSLKIYYEKIGMKAEYNAPTFLRYSDSFGNSFMRTQFADLAGGGLLTLKSDPRFYLRPSDVLRAEVEIDPSFDSSTYSIAWTISSDRRVKNDSRVLVLQISKNHVSVNFQIKCEISSKNDWHRLGFGVDDRLTIQYKVLPPI